MGARVSATCRLVITVVLAGSALAGCGGESPEVSLAPRLAVQPPADPRAAHPQPAWITPLTVSESKCFALGDPPNTAIVYAPDGATVLSDGDGFAYRGREFRLGQPLKGFSVLVRDFDQIDNPTQSLIDCQPTAVAWIWADW